MTSSKTVLVTGGAGFIGSNLIEALLKRGDKVVSLDNYFTGTRENHIAGAEYIEGHTKDIASLITFTPDLVYHLGEYARVEQSFNDADLVFDFNIVGTHAVLEFCRSKKCKLVYAGSSTKFSEDGLGRHQSPYAWSKASNTDLVVNYGAWFGLHYAVTYFYNVYGPRERSGAYGTVIQIFKEQFRAGKPLTVVAPGTQRRNFTHVHDIVAGLLLVGDKGEGDEFGLGSEESFSVLEIAQMFNTHIDMLPERKGNRTASALDASKSKALGWVVRNHIESYVQSFVNAESTPTRTSS